jgi:hypothetical protein
VGVCTIMIVVMVVACNGGVENGRWGDELWDFFWVLLLSGVVIGEGELDRWKYCLLYAFLLCDGMG